VGGRCESECLCVPHVSSVCFCFSSAPHCPHSFSSSSFLFSSPFTPPLLFFLEENWALLGIEFSRIRLKLSIKLKSGRCRVMSPRPFLFASSPRCKTRARFTPTPTHILGTHTQHTTQHTPMNSSCPDLASCRTVLRVSADCSSHHSCKYDTSSHTNRLEGSLASKET